VRSNLFIGTVCGLITVLSPPAFCQRAAAPPPLGQGIPTDDPVRVLVGRLDLEKYKATIKGLT